MRKPEESDQDAQAWLSELPRYEPRPGYVQRFWARAEKAAPSRNAVWRWMPAAAALLGLALGAALWQTRPGISPSQPAPLLITDNGLPAASLAAIFAVPVPGGHHD